MTSRKGIAIVGAGHNALVCACYLAKAGHDVTVFERRSRVGGAVNTEEMWWEPCEAHRGIGGNSSPRSDCASCRSEKYQVDTCSVMHILIHKTPVVQELQLEQFGLEYMQMDPWGFAPFPDGTHITFYKDLDRTCRSIAAVSERDAEAYRAFILAWDSFNQNVFELFNTAPSPGAAVGKIVLRAAAGQVRSRASARPSMGGLPLLRSVLGNYGKMLDETFESPQLKAAMAWMAAQSGPPPSEIGAGDLAGSQSLYHDVGATHPRGGSGMLSRALARCLESQGGSIRCDASVKCILVRDGRVRGIELQDGERFGADIVVSGAHLQITLLGLTDPGLLPASLRRQIEALRIHTGTGMTVRCAINELPGYLAQPAADAATSADNGGTIHSSMQLICPSVDYLQQAYNDAQQGQAARHPALVAMTPSAVDPSITPPGKHSLYIWAQYHPYTLANGESWDDIREREADRLLETLAEYAPNVASSVTHRYIQTPLDLERNVGLVGGNIMHIDMSLDQMFMFRPLPELSGYRTPIEGLYLTGASTHPGGGVSGASGRNAATAVQADLRPKERHWRGWALGAGAAVGAYALRRRAERKPKRTNARPGRAPSS